MGKSLPGNMGNVNLRGRKSKNLSCGCCVCTDKRGKFAAEQARKEMTDYMPGSTSSPSTTPPDQ